MGNNSKKSPLIYPGSKGGVIDDLLPLITGKTFKEYREPFLGSASVYLAVRHRCGGGDSGRRYWINDLNFELYNFWKMIQFDINSVILKILEFKDDDRFRSGKELFYHLKRNLYSYKNVELAAAYFILNRSAFSGGSLVSGFSQDHFDYLNNERINGLKDIKSLLSRRDVMITNLDYQKLVEAPPMSGNSNDDVMLFLDPPYMSATDSGLYGRSGGKWKNLHKTFDHYRFAKVMKECKFGWLVTYDDSPFIRNLFEFANQKRWTFTHKMRDDKVGKELLISNFKLTDTVHTAQKTLFDD